MNCEQVEELLSAYLDDQLTGHIYHAVTTHLEQCQHCYAILTSYRRYDALLAQLPRVEPPPHLRARLFSSPPATLLRPRAFLFYIPPILLIILLLLSYLLNLYRLKPQNNAK